MEKHKKQAIAILGSTGSIGVQCLDVIELHSELFEVTTLTSNNRWELLAQQAIKFNADSVVIANEQHYDKLSESLKDYPIKVYAGKEALEQVVCGENIDCVVSALVGYAGLAPTIAAIKCGKKIALANKETLVVAGELVMRLAKEHNAPIIPVDSEHSAIFQSLVGEYTPVEKLILTASGGPFFGYSKQQLESVTLAQALNHPNWSMGNKITIDSATMMNKGFEVIEARWLFDVPVSDIDVYVHRNSIVHSMIQFRDGAVKAQLGLPDMRQPIQYALSFPIRLPLGNKRLDFAGMNLTFDKVDTDTFYSLRLACEAIDKGGNLPCVLNAANEVAVGAFLSEQISFLDIPRLTQQAMKDISFVGSPSLEDYHLTDLETRKYVNKLITKI